jgi:plastocyanin
MQHPDEGTIHSWLDGALSAEEAARVQAHVEECPQCAAAVAEARGFIAASSRILTALDHVPSGVVPASLPVSWYNRPAWRAAAAVLVVAVGSLVVVRNSEQDKVAATTVVSDSSRVPVEAAAQQSQTAAPTTSPSATTSKPQVATSAAPPNRNVAVSGAARGGNATQAGISGKSVRGAAPSNVAPRERARDEAVDTIIGLNAAAAPQVAGVAIAAPQAAQFSRTAGAATILEAREPEQLKVVGTPRMIGAKVTLYEVAPGDTVTFIEASNVQLDAVVTTGTAGGEPLARRSAAKSGTVAPARLPSTSPGVPTLQVAVENGVTTISWPDAITGTMLSLSGRMSAERLKEIRLRIERERAAAAPKKKP